ncbi:MAG: hypothetical protein ACRC5H_02745 [Treponemataceae bacterium]
MINGIVYDFQSIKLMLPSGPVILCEDISYKDKIDSEVVTGMNGLPVGVGMGEYSGTCDVVFSRSDYERATLIASFYNLGAIPIVIFYGHLGQIPIIDTLMVHFNDRDFSAKKGDKNLNVSLKGVLTKVLITNGKPAYVSV